MIGTVCSNISRTGFKHKYYTPLQNPTLGILVAEEGNILGWQTGLWSTKAKV
jgi:hypothetical protein